MYHECKLLDSVVLVTECRLTANGTVFNLVALLETGHDVQRKEAKAWDMVRWVERKGSSAVDTFSEGRIGGIYTIPVSSGLLSVQS